MESVGSAMKKSFRPEPPVGPALAADEMVWAVEKSGLFLAGDDFLVDDLLDLGELTESENEDAAAAPPPPPVAAAAKEEGADSSPFDPAPLSLPAPDEAELEWVSRIVDDSEEVYPVDRTLTGTRPLAPPLANPTLCTLSTESLPPVSVKAKRSKRSRTVTVGVVWSISNPPPFTDSSDSSTGLTNDSSSSSCSSPSSYSSYLVYDHSAAAGLAAPVLLDSSPAKRHRPKKRGRKPKAHQAHNHPLPLPPAAGERRCSHCGVNKTPQWRTGPQGAKTLCNACGVRFKSGRLLPEYRPACSPTFLSHVHSNSHRKVLEMRRKKEEQLLSAVAPPVTSF